MIGRRWQGPATALAVASAVTAGAVWLPLVMADPPDATSLTARPRVVPQAEETPQQVLRAWNARRAAAWAAGDRDLLRSLYTPGAEVGRVDLSNFDRWQVAGFRVRGMVRQTIGLRVVERGTDRFRVRATERMTGAVAVSDGWHRALPTTAPSTRVLTFARTGGRWVMTEARVRPGPG